MNKQWFLSNLKLGARSGGEDQLLHECSHIIRDKDSVFLIGDVATSKQSYWLSRIQKMPGKKTLLLGPNDRNRTKWYEKFGFIEVIPFNRFKIAKYLLGSYYVDTGRGLQRKDRWGNVMVSYLPASPFGWEDIKYAGLVKKFHDQYKVYNCVFNINFGVGSQPVSLEQIAQSRYKL